MSIGSTQCAAVAMRSGAISVPPQIPVPTNHGTDEAGTRWPPTTACADGAKDARASRAGQ